MIPKTFITEWSAFAPWLEPRQIEQDLIITTALLKLYNHPILRETLAFRGGTALNKLIFKPASRYSEDIDLVQITGSPIGPTIDLLTKVMDPWLGKPKKKFPKNCAVLEYRIISEDGFPIKLKFEINTREHFAILELKETEFSSSSSWHPGNALIKTYHLEELLGTKLRALYQRRKGRDLYDLYMALTKIETINHDLIIHCFREYLAHENLKVPRKVFLDAMEEKMMNKEFREDILPLLPMQARNYNPEIAYRLVRELLIEKL
jgi:predicted nucleotidyltransferase component of viral defense system